MFTLTTKEIDEFEVTILSKINDYDRLRQESITLNNQQSRAYSAGLMSGLAEALNLLNKMREKDVIIQE